MTSKKLYRRALLLYYRYKDTPYFSLSLYTGTLLVCVLLLLYIIIPEIQSVFSIQEEVRLTRQRIATINDNISVLLSLDDVELDNQFVTATAALPPERDISSLIAAVNLASLKAGVLLNDFALEGNNQSAKSSVEAFDEDTTSQITFSVNGSLDQTVKLLTELQQKMPLLAISTITSDFSSSGQTQVTLSYYYKAFPLVKEDPSQEVKRVSPQNKLLLEKLKSWEPPQDTFTPAASEGATILPPL